MTFVRKRAQRAAWLGLVAALLAGAGSAYAQDEPNPEDARAVYDRGVAAHGRQDYAEAAKLFAQADDLAPNDTALRAALEAAVLADEPVLAMTLTDRAKQRPPDEGVQQAVAEAKAKFASRTGQLTVRCAGPIRCRVSVDGRLVDSDRAFWVLIGTRALVISFGNEQVNKSVEVRAGARDVVEVVPPAAPEPAKTEPPPRKVTEPPPPTRDVTPETDSAFSSPWFWVGAGLTATFAAASVWSATDVSSKHDDFAAGCAKFDADGCDDEASSGKNAQLRTNLLLGATALAGAATVVVVLVPSRPSEPTATSGFLPVLTARGRF